MVRTSPTASPFSLIITFKIKKVPKNDIFLFSAKYKQVLHNSVHKK